MPKVSLRCQGCRLLFGYSQLETRGVWDLDITPKDDQNVEVSDIIFMERSLLELQCSLAKVNNYI